MKKRIGNDISFVWHIYRKDGDAQVPESFADKDVTIKLISPLQRTVTIEDVSIATGVVTFTFKGKYQTTLGNYVAILQENRGEDGMVTLDVVSAVTLVPHSYMEEDGDDGDVIEAESVELTSTISAGAGGGIEQQQADWAQTDDTAVDFIKNKPNLDVFARLDSNNVHTAGYDRYRHEYEQIDAETTIQDDGISSYNYNKDGSLREMTSFIPGSITLIKDGVTLSLSYRYFANLVASIQAKADVADLASLVNTGTYNSTSKKIELKHDNNVLAEIDATAFIKDGMVDSVVVSNGYIVITFNTDAGKETIRIPVTDIFDPSNYYDKDDIDGLLADKVDKETGKGLSTNDYTDSDKEKVSSISLPGETYSISQNQWILDGNIATNSEGVLKIEATAWLTPTIVNGRLVLTRIQSIYTPYFKVYSPFEGTLRIRCYEWVDSYKNWQLELGYLTDYSEKYHQLEPFYESSDNTDIALYVKAGWNTIRGGIGGSNNGQLIIGGISLQKGILALNSRVTEHNMGLMTPQHLSDLNNKVDKVTGKGLSTNDYTTAEKTKLGALPTNEELTQALGGKANTSDLAEVATSGSYNDLTDKPTIPDITGKADKVNNATNGNFAALDSNGNLTDSGHKHSDYLTSHQDLSNYVQKSQTAGLLKNNGTVDTTQYLSQHQDISGKEDITPIEAVASGTTAITAQVNKYYEMAGTVSSLTITLPTPTTNTEVTMVVVHLTVGASPTVVVTSVNEIVRFSAAYSVVANKEYELSCLYNGSKWIVSSMEVAV